MKIKVKSIWLYPCQGAVCRISVCVFPWPIPHCSVFLSLSSSSLPSSDSLAGLCVLLPSFTASIKSLLSPLQPSIVSESGHHPSKELQPCSVHFSSYPLCRHLGPAQLRTLSLWNTLMKCKLNSYNVYEPVIQTKRATVCPNSDIDNIFPLYLLWRKLNKLDLFINSM